MQSLLAALRSAMPPAVWSRGVNFCREGRVSFLHPEALAGDEVEAQVRPAQGGVATSVVLYPDDDDWSCDCDQAACAHAAAAAIALGQARAGRLPPSTAQQTPLQVHHVFVRHTAGLGLRRQLVCPRGQRPPEDLAVPLAVRQRQPGPPVIGLASDVAVDALLAGRRQQDALGAPLLARVLAALVDATNVWLEEQAVGVGESILALRVRLHRQAGGGLLLRAEGPEGLEETFANGAGRFGKTLRALVAVQLSARDQQALRTGQYFALGQRATLLGDVLPRLRRLLPVDDTALADVQTVQANVRVAFHVRGPADAAQRPEGAVVTAQLIYCSQDVPEKARETLRGGAAQTGREHDPQDAQGQRFSGTGPAAAATEAGARSVVGRIVGDRLESMGDAVPLRDPAAEKRVAAALQDALQFIPGHGKTLIGAGAVATVRALRAWARAHGGRIEDPNHALAGWRLARALRPQWRPDAGGDAFGALAFVPTWLPENADDGDGDAHGFRDGFWGGDSDNDLPGGGVWAEDGAAGAVRSPRAATRGACVDLAAVWAAHSTGAPFVALPGGGFAPVPGPLLAEHAAPLRALLLARAAARAAAGDPGGTSTPLPGWALAAVGSVGDALGVTVPVAAHKAAAALTEVHAHGAGYAVDGAGAALPANRAPVVAPPPGFHLRPYQSHGIAWLRAREEVGVGALLADDMGLGKTLQTLLALPRRVLVVAPTSVLANWAEEAARFRPDCQAAIYHGSQRDRRTLTTADWVLTSYGVLRLEADTLAAAGFAALVLDEAHTIKRAGSQVTQAAYHVGRHVRFRLALTGTPLENRSEDLYSLLHFLNPGWLGSAEHFAQTIARPLQAGDAAAAEQLRQRLAPVVLRRRKIEVARDLPPRTDVVLRNNLDPAERSVYQALAHATRKDVVARLAAGEGVMAALEALLRLRQAACDVGLLPGHGAAPPSSKLRLLLEVLTQGIAEGHRALVFSQWTGLLDRVAPLLRAADIAYVRLDGTTRDRQQVVQTFASPAGPPVLLMSLKAGGVGLNLTAADHVFLLDPWWNPAAEDQAADRANRIGQTRPVFVHRLVSDDTVEEAIVALQNDKRRLAAAALSDEDGAVASSAAGLTRAELLRILGGSESP